MIRLRKIEGHEKLWHGIYPYNPKDMINEHYWRMLVLMLEQRQNDFATLAHAVQSHPLGGERFVRHCVKQGWLVIVPPEIRM